MEDKVIPHRFHEDLPHVVSFNAKSKFVQRSHYCRQDCNRCINFAPATKQCKAVSIMINFPLFESCSFLEDHPVSL